MYDMFDMLFQQRPSIMPPQQCVDPSQGCPMHGARILVYTLHPLIPLVIIIIMCGESASTLHVTAYRHYTQLRIV